jgi:hypothetical protein
MHNRYGKLNGISTSKEIYNRPFSFANGLIEIPLSTINLGGISIPFAGGVYLRILPYRIFKFGIKTILRKANFYTFYFHPWEIDYDQPRIDNIKFNYKFRHYTGLKSCYAKLEKLLSDFSFVPVKDYLNTDSLSEREMVSDR